MLKSGHMENTQFTLPSGINVVVEDGRPFVEMILTTSHPGFSLEKGFVHTKEEVPYFFPVDQDGCVIIDVGPSGLYLRAADLDHLTQQLAGLGIW